MCRFHQEGTEDIAELEELSSWDHGLHLTRICLGHRRCIKQN